MPKQEKIIPPTSKALTDASNQLKGKHPSGGRVLADQSVAKREGAKRGIVKQSSKRG